MFLKTFQFSIECNAKKHGLNQSSGKNIQSTVKRIIKFSSVLTKTGENCFYVVNLYFPCTLLIVNCFHIFITWSWRSYLTVRFPLGISCKTMLHKEQKSPFLV